MRKSYSISLNYLKPLTSDDLERLEQVFLDMKYDDDQGYGFSNVRVEEKYLRATLIKRTPTFIPQFDINTGELVEQEIFLFSEIEFALDAQFKLLEIFGPIKQASKVRKVIRPLVDVHTRLVSVDLSPTKAIQQLLSDLGIIRFDSLAINNFQHSEGIVGRYLVKQVETKQAETLIKNYSYDIVKGTVSVLLPEFDEFILQVSNNGSFRITCEETQFTDIYLHLKSVYFTREV